MKIKNKEVINIVKLGSLFSGSGTCELAATFFGIVPIWNSEIEKFPVQVTEKRFPLTKQLGDITKINGSEIEPVDIITFGSPCTNLSVAGKQNGFNITFTCHGVNDKLKEPHFTKTIRATDKTKYLYEMDCPICGNKLTQTNESALFFNAIRVIQEMREATNNEYPRFILWENVPGAFSSNKGSDFRKVLEEIAESEFPMPDGGKWAKSGMVELPDRQIAWRVLDAQYWGVPQRRKRIFLVTDFRDKRAGEILFKPESLFGNIAKGNKTKEGIAKNLKRYLDEASWSGKNRTNQSRILTAGFMGGQGSKSGGIGYQEETSPTLKSTSSGGNTVPSIVTYDARGNGDGDKCCTITGDHENRVTDYTALVVNPTSYGFCPDNSITAAGVGCEKEKTPTLSTTKRMGVAFACNQRDEVRDLKDCASALQAQPGMKQQTFCLQGNMIGRNDKNGPQGDGINEDVSFTLNTTDKHAVLASGKPATGTLMANCSTKLWLGNQEAFSGDYNIIQNKQARRLTPTECARLQGFPDWWCTDIPHKDTSEYKMWGNGMALPCVLYIMQNIADIYKMDGCELNNDWSKYLSLPEGIGVRGKNMESNVSD